MPQKQAKSETNNANALKHMFGAEHLQRIATAIHLAYPQFNKSKITQIYQKLSALEMKPRVHLIRDTLRSELPEKFPHALKILLLSVEKGSLKGFDLWPYTEFIQTYGIEHAKLSLDALKKLTKLFTSEWAVRPFLTRNATTTLTYLLKCSRDKNVHVRRWASEGSRPRLPWGERLSEFIVNPHLTLNILETLKYDSELYVRKSVANHLNDISKDHPELVTKLLSGWKRSAPTVQRAKIDWITSHALRTLIKQGDRRALKLIGVATKTEVRLKQFTINKKICRLGDKLVFSCLLESSSKSLQKLVVDYVIHYMRANQKLTPKVFKLKNVQLAANKSISITKSHHFKKVSTRTHYSGVHVLEIQVNGLILKSYQLNLISN